MTFVSHKRKNLNAWVLYFLWPFWAAIVALKNFRAPWAKNIIWAFTAFYGFTFAIGAESQGSDIVRYIEEVQYLYGQKMNVSDAIRYYLNSGEIDVFRTAIAFLVSRTTDHHAILTLVYAIIFGYFYSRNIWFVLNQLNGKLKWTTIVLMASFMLIIPIWFINGFRMWTAAQIFIFGVFNFFFGNSRKGWVIVLLSCTVHFSFIVLIISLLIYKIFGNRKTILFYLFVVTSVGVNIDLGQFNRMVESYAPEIVQERTSSYRNVDKIEEIRLSKIHSDRRWYARWYSPVIKWIITGFLIILYYKGADFFRMNFWWYNYYCFLLLFFSIANIMGAIASGGRFVSVALMLALALIVIFVQNDKIPKAFKQFYYFALPGLFLFILVSLRMGFYSLDLFTIIGNPIMAILLINESIPLNDMLKGLL